MCNSNPRSPVIKDDHRITVATPLSAGSLAKGAQGAQVVMNSFQFCATLTVHWWKLQLLIVYICRSKKHRNCRESHWKVGSEGPILPDFLVPRFCVFLLLETHLSTHTTSRRTTAQPHRLLSPSWGHSSAFSRSGCHSGEHSDGQRELPQDESCLSNRLQRASLAINAPWWVWIWSRKLVSFVSTPMSSSIDCVPDLHVFEFSVLFFSVSN